MTDMARALPGQHLLPLSVVPHVREWAAKLETLTAAGRTVAVAHSPDRAGDTHRLADRFGSPVVCLERIDSLVDRLVWGDMAVVVTSSGRRRLGPARGVGGLRALLRGGIVVWGLTGPRPNTVSPYCHDVVAVAVTDTQLLARRHRAVIERLISRPTEARGRRPASGT